MSNNGPPKDLMNVNYNGVQIYRPHIVPQSVTVESPAGRWPYVTVINLNIVGYVFWYDQQDKAAYANSVLAALSQPGRTFTWEENQQVIATIGPAGGAGSGYVPPDGPGQYSDVNYGPKASATIISNDPYSFKVHFVLTAEVGMTVSQASLGVQVGLPNANTQGVANYGNSLAYVTGGLDQGVGSDLIDSFAQASYDIDETGNTTRTIQGAIIIAGKYGTWFDLGTGPDSYRLAVLNQNRFLAQSILIPPPYYQRVHQNFTPQADGKTLTWAIVDRQTQFLPPFPAGDWSCRVAIETTGWYQLGTSQKEVTCCFTLPPQTSPQQQAINSNGTNLQNFTGIAAQIITTLVYSDPAAREFIEVCASECVDMKTNRWVLHIQSLHQRSLLYSTAWPYCGLFSSPPNSGTLYGFPLPYGTTGLLGTAYNATMDAALGRLQPEGFNTTPPGFSGSSGPGMVTGAEVIEGNVVSMKQQAKLINQHGSAVSVITASSTGTPTPTSSTTTTNAGTLRAVYTDNSPMLIWSGYKITLANPSDPTGYGQLPTPQVYFTIVPKFTKDDLSTSTPPSTPLKAVVAYESVEPHQTIIDQAGGTKLYNVRYAFAVYLTPAAAATLLTSGTTTIIPIPNSIDNVNDIPSIKLLSSLPSKSGTAPTPGK